MIKTRPKVSVAICLSASLFFFGFGGFSGWMLHEKHLESQEADRFKNFKKDFFDQMKELELSARYARYEKIATALSERRHDSFKCSSASRIELIGANRFKDAREYYYARMREDSFASISYFDARRRIIGKSYRNKSKYTISIFQGDYLRYIEEYLMGDIIFWILLKCKESEV